jgi:hypothetical protein
MKKINIKIQYIIICVILAFAGIITFQKIAQNSSNKQTAAPQENMFYLAQKGDTPILFYRYPDLLVEHKKPSSSIGHIASFDRPYNLKKDPNEFINFDGLKNPKKLFSFEGHPGIENYQLSSDKQYLLISFVGGRTDTTNYIYQIDLKRLTTKKIWENELRTGEPPYNGGIAYITNSIPDRYVVFAIVKSAPPPEALPVSVIIKNIQSGEEKVLGVVGNTKLDLEAGTISFSELEKKPVPCGKDDPACFATDTYKYEYQPEGEHSTQPLP